MQREIEFRIWDIEEKTWVNARIWHNANSFFCMNEAGNIYWFRNPERFAHQQFTGLLDKNGVKIFEGDIIRHGCTTQEYESVVAYKAPSFITKTFSYKRENHWRAEKPKEFDVIWEKKGIEAFNEGWYMGDRSFDGDNYIEIIGNIFENPELLNQ